MNRPVSSTASSTAWMPSSVSVRSMERGQRGAGEDRRHRRPARSRGRRRTWRRSAWRVAIISTIAKPPASLDHEDRLIGPGRVLDPAARARPARSGWCAARRRRWSTGRPAGAGAGRRIAARRREPGAVRSHGRMDAAAPSRRFHRVSRQNEADAPRRSPRSPSSCWRWPRRRAGARRRDAPAPVLPGVLLAWRFDPLAISLLVAGGAVYLWAVGA